MVETLFCAYVRVSVGIIFISVTFIGIPDDFTVAMLAAGFLQCITYPNKGETMQKCYACTYHLTMDSKCI
jgi:hypothetical protein